MTLHELESPQAVESFKTTNPNSLICFSATWCGPCRASKPALTDLADSHSTGPLSAKRDLKVGIAYEHNLGDALHSKYGVRAFPTYVLYVKGGSEEAGRVEGANLEGVKAMIEKAGGERDMGEGHSLGGGGEGAAPASAEEARRKRLERLGIDPDSEPPSSAPKPAQDTEVAAAEEPAPMETDEGEKKPPAEAEPTKDAEMKDAGDTAGEQCIPVPDSNDQGEEQEMVDPTESLDSSLVETLTSGMGFPLLRAQKGLLNGGGTVEGAVEWLSAHQDDDDIDDPIPKVAKSEGGGGTAQSYKCNECGKILSNMANLELHANKTGHSDFEESTVAVKPLTAEEKLKKIEEIKSLLKAKRTEREEQEKADNVDREKQRRFMGKEMSKTREEMERQARMREAKQRKKEKEAFKRERERIREELARDKAERQANKGKLHSTLGAEGYNPSAIQYDAPAGEGAEGGDGDASAAKKPKPAVKKGNPAKIDEYIKKVSSYRAGGDGQRCIKILLAYVGNVVDKPDEEKFRTVKTENKVYKTRVKPFLGARSLLVAVGFSPSEDGNLVLRDDCDRDLLSETKSKLEKAYAAY